MSVKVIKFSADWCGPCQTLSPIVKEIAAEFPDVEFQYVDVDENPALAQQFSVASIPTMVFLKDGVEQKTLVGLQKATVIRAEVKALL